MNKQFWSDVWTVMRKEWLEWMATPGCMIQPLVVVIIFGVFAPLLAGSLWLEYPIIQWVWSWLPLALSAGMVADTFAGERERDTLEALLASRLPDRAIVLGKVAAVAAYGWAITFACWLAGWITVRAAFASAFASAFNSAVGAMPAPAYVLAWPLLLSGLGAWFIACVGVLISLRAQSVRQAQQMLSVAMLGTLLVVGLLTAELLNLGMGEAAGAVLGGIAAVLALLDLFLLGVLLIRPQRSEWLIY
jgi:ABC-2 type transport system permease protein